jgi:hypothetical protein
MKARIVIFGACKVSNKDIFIPRWFCLNYQCKLAMSHTYLSS